MFNVLHCVLVRRWLLDGNASAVFVKLYCQGRYFTQLPSPVSRGCSVGLCSSH